MSILGQECLRYRTRKKVGSHQDVKQLSSKNGNEKHRKYNSLNNSFTKAGTRMCVHILFRSKLHSFVGMARSKTAMPPASEREQTDQVTCSSRQSLTHTHTHIAKMIIGKLSGKSSNSIEISVEKHSLLTYFY